MWRPTQNLSIILKFKTNCKLIHTLKFENDFFENTSKKNIAIANLSIQNSSKLLDS